MYLEKLEINGFKSFANKTSLDFLPPRGESKGMTAVVGPNGSGKSNIADAIRWVLGEQSSKNLRGKKGEDVIFSGSSKRGRSGFAEVTLTLNNEDGAIKSIEAAEIAITRRIYRDGQSEYLINQNSTRLSDVQLMLAEAQIGARSYSVIGQGMIDSVLVASPAERKDFFDEATGVRQYQIKRNQASNKLQATKDNLAQADVVVAEIEPRLKSLSRQVRRLEERVELEQKLHSLEHQYYGALWHQLSKDLATKKERISALKARLLETQDENKKNSAMLESFAKEEAVSEDFTSIQQKYLKLIESRDTVKEREMTIKNSIQQLLNSSTPAQVMTISKIIAEFKNISDLIDGATSNLKNLKSLEDLPKLILEFDGINKSASSLVLKMDKPVEEKKTIPKELQNQLVEATAEVAKLAGAIFTVQEEMRNFNENEKKKKGDFFRVQRELQEQMQKNHRLEQELNGELIDFARVETRLESLEREMSQELGERSARIKQEFVAQEVRDASSVAAEIQRYKYQLQLIGGIDPEVVREHQETAERFEFLSSQSADLREAMVDLEKVIDELDRSIKAKSEGAFRNLNRDFQKFFATLFGGGKAELVLIKETDVELDAVDAEEKSAKTTDADAIVGIDIIATPPGKKISSISILSGGERALTSIALISAIMMSNPSPFVVLDEVDAALDESNADRFGSILEELAHQTQFVVITHNRYTMRRANVLYGVSMGDDSTSNVISVDLDRVLEKSK